MSKAQLTIVALLGFLVYDEVVLLRNKKRMNKLRDLTVKVVEMYKQSDKENDYLRHLLDENEVPASEFDLIVLANIRSEV